MAPLITSGLAYTGAVNVVNNGTLNGTYWAGATFGINSGETLISPATWDSIMVP